MFNHISIFCAPHLMLFTLLFNSISIIIEESLDIPIVGLRSCPSLAYYILCDDLYIL
jgi:hypothetical protein